MFLTKSRQSSSVSLQPDKSKKEIFWKRNFYVSCIMLEIFKGKLEKSSDKFYNYLFMLEKSETTEISAPYHGISWQVQKETICCKLRSFVLNKEKITKMYLSERTDFFQLIELVILNPPYAINVLIVKKLLKWRIYNFVSLLIYETKNENPTFDILFWSRKINLRWLKLLNVWEKY